MLQNYCSRDKIHEVGSSTVDSEWNNVVNLFFELRDLLDDCNKEAQHSWAIIDKVQRSASIITLELEDLEREISEQSVSEPDTIGIEPYCDHLLNSLYLKKEKVSVETQVEPCKENILQKIKCPIYRSPHLEQFAAYFKQNNVICTNIQNLIQNAVSVEVIPEPYIRRFYSLDENFIQMYSLSRYNVINPTYSRSIDCLETLLNRCVITELDDCYEVECYNAIAYEDSCEKPAQETRLIKYCEFSDIKLIDGTKRVSGRLKTESPEPLAEREKSEVRFIAVVKSDKDNSVKEIKEQKPSKKQAKKEPGTKKKPTYQPKPVTPKPVTPKPKNAPKPAKISTSNQPIKYHPKPVIRPKTDDKSGAKIPTTSYLRTDKPRKVPKVKTSIDVKSSGEEVVDEDVEELQEEEDVQDEEELRDRSYHSEDYLECEELIEDARTRGSSGVVMFDFDKPFPNKNRFQDCDDRAKVCDERVLCDEIDDRINCDELIDQINDDQEIELDDQIVEYEDQIIECDDISEYDEVETQQKKISFTKNVELDVGDQLIDFGEPSQTIKDPSIDLDKRKYQRQKGDYEPIGREPSISQYRRNSGQTINISEQKIVGDFNTEKYKIVVGSNVKYSPAKRNETKQKSMNNLYVSDVQAKVHPPEELTKGSQTEEKNKFHDQQTSTMRHLITTSTQYDVPEVTTETKLVSFPSRRSKNQETNTVATYSYLALADKKFCDIKRVRFKSKSTQLTPEDVIYFKRLKKMLKKSRTSIMSSSLKSFFSNFVNKNILSMNVQLDKLTRQEIQNAKKLFLNILSFLKSDVDKTEVQLEDLPNLNLNLDPNVSILEDKSDNEKLNETQNKEPEEADVQISEKSPSCSQKSTNDLLIYQPKNDKNEVYLKCSDSKRKILKKYYEECKSLGLPVTLEKLFRDLKRKTKVKFRRKDDFSFRKYISRQQASCEKEIVNILKRLNEGNLKEDSQIWLSKCHHKLLVSLEQLYCGNSDKRKTQFSHQAKELLKKLKESSNGKTENPKSSSSCRTPNSKKLQTSQKGVSIKPQIKKPKMKTLDKLVCLRQSISRPNSEVDVRNDENIPSRSSPANKNVQTSRSNSEGRRGYVKTSKPNSDRAKQASMLTSKGVRLKFLRSNTEVFGPASERSGTSRPNCEANSQTSKTSRSNSEANSPTLKASRSKSEANSQNLKTSRSKSEANSQNLKISRSKSQSLNDSRPNSEANSHTLQTSRANCEANSQTLKTSRSNNEANSQTLETSRPNSEVNSQNFKTSRPNSGTNSQTLNTSRPNSEAKSPILAASWPNCEANSQNLKTSGLTSQTLNATKPNNEANIQTLKTSRPNSEANSQNLKTSRSKSQSVSTSRPNSEANSQTLNTSRPNNEANSQTSKTSRPNSEANSQTMNTSRPKSEANSQNLKTSRPKNEANSQTSKTSRPNSKANSQTLKTSRPNTEANSYNLKSSRPSSKADDLKISKLNSRYSNEGKTSILPNKPSFSRSNIKIQTSKVEKLRSTFDENPSTSKQNIENRWQENKLPKKPKSANKICQVKPKFEGQKNKTKLQKDEKSDLNDFNKLSNVMDVLDVDVDPQNIFKTLSQSSNVKKEESNSKESGYNESFDISEVKGLKKFSSKNIVTGYKTKKKKKSFENKIAEIRKTQKNYLEEIDTALRNCEKPKNKICDFETLCDIHEKEKIFKKRDFNATKEKLRECILGKSKSYGGENKEKEDIKRFISQESYKMILIKKSEKPSGSISFFSSESYSISYKPSEKILVKDYERNPQMKNISKYQKEIRDLKKDIERKIESEKTEGFRSSLDSIEFWKSLEKSSKRTEKDFSVYTNLTGNMVSEICLDENSKRHEYEMYPEALSKWLKTPSIEELERQKREKIKKKEKKKNFRPSDHSTIGKKRKESPKGDFKNIKLVPKYNQVFQKDYKTKLKKSTVESFLKALQEYWSVLDESLRLYNLALKKDNLKSISKFYSKTRHEYCKERSMLLYKHLVSVDKSRKKMCGDFDGSSPKAMSLPVKYDKDIKKVDSKHKVNKTTLEYVKNELATLKSQINRNLFAEIRNEIANSSINENELKKIVHSIDVELEKIKSSEKQIDLLIEDIKQRIELEGDLDDLQTRFEKDFVSKFEYECSKISQDEALRKFKQEAITETKNQLNEKLTEINDLIQLQIQEQSRQEKERNNSEISLRKKLEHIGDVLQTELNNIQSVLSGCQTEDNEKKDLKSKEYSKRRNMFEQFSTEDKEEKNIKETSPKQGKGSVVKAKLSLEEKINEDLKDKYLKKK